MPICVGRIGHQSPVKIRRAIRPPHRSTFAQGALCCVDRGACLALGFCVARLQGGAHLPARIHEPFNQLLPLFRCKIGMTHAPEAARYHEVPSVRCAWMFLRF